jgi:hypothetical protein
MSRRESAKATLHFIVRSCFMGLMNSLMLLSIVYVLGSINTVQVFFIGIILFIATLVITRLFSKQIEKATHITLKYLDRHQRIRGFILKYL